MVQHVFRGLTGYEVLPPSSYLDTFAKQAASDEQERFCVAVASKMMANNYNIKTAFIEVIKSGWFRAKNAATADREELIGVGGGANHLPEVLSRKINSLFGSRWKDNSGCNDQLAWREEGTYNRQYCYGLLYGGIDSLQVTKRIRKHSGLSASVIEKMSIDMSCYGAVKGLTKSGDPAKAKLFPFVSTADLPGAGDAKIKQNIQYLHQALLGEQLPIDHSEITETYNVFKNAIAAHAGASSTMNSTCGQGSAVSDANFTVRGWQAVLMYLLQDYRFIVE
jgi:hypothetical protein